MLVSFRTRNKRVVVVPLVPILVRKSSAIFAPVSEMPIVEQLHSTRVSCRQLPDDDELEPLDRIRAISAALK